VPWDSRASFVSTSASGFGVCVGEFAFQSRPEFPVAAHHLVASAGNTAWVACYDTARLLRYGGGGGGAGTDTDVDADKDMDMVALRPTSVLLIGDGVQGAAVAHSNPHSHSEGGSGSGGFVVLSRGFGPGDSTLEYHDLALAPDALALSRSTLAARTPPSTAAAAAAAGGGREGGGSVSDSAAAAAAVVVSLVSGATLTNKVFMPALAQVRFAVSVVSVLVAAVVHHARPVAGVTSTSTRTLVPIAH
jgi:hypothetical protein